jgi:SAM-dependent methyltransferase
LGNMPRMSDDVLLLYRHAVQHPEAEVEFLLRTFAHYHQGELPSTLREDFCGTAAVAAAWVAFDPTHEAVGIDHDEPTLRWAWQRAQRLLGDRADDLHLLAIDVMDVDPDTVPPVDVIAALNFSVLIYHSRETLDRYFAAAFRGLASDGMVVVDLYGGRGAWQIGTQQRRIEPASPEEPCEPFDYHWQQAAADPLTQRVLNHIHFDPGHGRMIRQAFSYDWRLWSPADLLASIRRAGFAAAELWCDRHNPVTGQSNGTFEPMNPVDLDDRIDWVAYAVGLRRAGRGRG